MARHKEAPFHVESKDGRALLYYSTPEGKKRHALGFAYAGDERASPAERRAAHEAAETKYLALTNGRVVDDDPVVKTGRTLPEIYSLFIDQFEPNADDDENTRRKKKAGVTVLRGYGRSIMEWASHEARRPDGTKRWNDGRTPMQRLCSEGGPEDYLAFRLTLVIRGSMRKEKSNLVNFFSWAKAHGFVRSLPAIVLPPGRGTPAVENSGRGVDIGLTDEEAARIVAVMPEWSSKPSRARDPMFDRTKLYEVVWQRPVLQLANELEISEVALAKRCRRLAVPVPPRGYWQNPQPEIRPELPPVPAPTTEKADRFLVRPFFEFMLITSLRPVTVMRLVSGAGRNWKSGMKYLDITNADDKAKYGRRLPLSPQAVKLLEKYAPTSGHIFGHHDFRNYIYAAAKLVLDGKRADLFGSYHLRHFMGTFFASRSTNLTASMYVLGHTSAETHSRYVHAREKEAATLVKKTSPELRRMTSDAKVWATETLRKAGRKAAREGRHVH